MKWLRLIVLVFLIPFASPRDNVAVAKDGVLCSVCEQQLNQCLADMCNGQDDCQYCYPEYNTCRSTCTYETPTEPCEVHGTSGVSLQGGSAATFSATDTSGSCAYFNLIEVVGRALVDGTLVADSGEVTYGTSGHVRMDWSDSVNASKVEQYGSHFWVQGSTYGSLLTYDKKEQ